MGSTTFSGPIKAGPIKDTSGTTLGRDVKNTGFAVMAQAFDAIQADVVTPTNTGIVIPSHSTIISVSAVAQSAFDGVEAGLTLTDGNGGTAVANADISGNGFLQLGCSAPDLWTDTGPDDIELWAEAVNTGGGVARIIVTYLQNFNAS